MPNSTRFSSCSPGISVESSTVIQPGFPSSNPKQAQLAVASGVRSNTVTVGAVRPFMKLVRDLPLWPLWVNPEHRVKSALVMMRGHGVPCLGVVKGDTFLGVLCIEDLVGFGDEEPVE